jgi:hypothetical protein
MRIESVAQVAPDHARRAEDKIAPEEAKDRNDERNAQDIPSVEDKLGGARLGKLVNRLADDERDDKLRPVYDKKSN